MFIYFFFFFFQAEDGIRDGTVTGVQTCALPIYRMKPRSNSSRNYGTNLGVSRAFKNRPMPMLSTDRKSTRLNSSHSSISYAVFRLKKKIYYLGVLPLASLAARWPIRSPGGRPFT